MVILMHNEIDKLIDEHLNQEVALQEDFIAERMTLYQLEAEEERMILIAEYEAQLHANTHTPR